MSSESESGYTPGPWPIEYTGDGKRIIVGAEMVEGPHGYDIAEVYSDDCPAYIAVANARLIAAAPDLLEALIEAEEQMVQMYHAIAPWAEGRMADGDPVVINTRAAIARALGTGEATARTQENG